MNVAALDAPSLAPPPRINWRQIPPHDVVSDGALDLQDRDAIVNRAVSQARNFIRRDTPGNVVPPREAVVLLAAAGVEWRCRLTPDRSRSIKGSYQWRPGSEGRWRRLADTPQQDGAA